MKTEQLLKAINGDLDQIQKLMKSYEDKTLEKADVPAPAPAPDAAPAAAPEQGAGGWDPSAASNEDLLSMLEELMQIVEQRLGGGGEDQPPAPEAGDGTQPSQQGEPLAMAEGDEGEMPDLPQEGEGEMEPEAGEGEAHEGMESPDVESAEQDGEAPDAADMGGEGEIEMDESPEALQQEIAALSPEDLQKLKAAVDAVMAQSVGGEEAAAPVEKSVIPFKKALPKVASAKESKGGAHNGSSPQSSNLVKSLSNLCDGLEKLAKQVREPQGKPMTNYADANLRVLEKSSPASAMDGETLANWLLTEQRKGNKLVKSLHVAAANCAKTPETLSEVYNNLKAAGIQVP